MTAPTSTSADDPAAPDAPHWQVSGMAERFRAASLDGGLIMLIGLFVSFILIVAGLWTDDGDGEHLSSSGAFTFWAVATVYLGANESRRGPRNGQTPGKRQQGIRTVTADGGLPLSRTRAWLRASALGLLLPYGLPIEYVVAQGLDIGARPGNPIFIVSVALFVAFAGASRLRRTPHDWLSGTAVVDAHMVDGEPEADAALARPLPLIGENADRSIVTGSLVIAAAGIFLLLAPPT